MKIVWLLPYPPLPVTTGGRRRVKNLISRLSGNHEIILVAYHRGEPEHIIKELEGLVSSVHLIERRPTRSPWNPLLWAMSPWPFMVVANSFNSRMVDTLRHVVKTEKPDLVHCEHFHMWRSLTQAKTTHWPPVLLSQQGLEFLVTERFLRVHHSPLRWAGLRIELAKAKRYETQACHQADGLILVSEKDRELLARVHPLPLCWIVRNGVDLKSFKPVVKHHASNPTILFVGTFSFFGNRDALTYIIKEILPEVRRQQPGVVLQVIGERAPRINIPGVEILGAVDDLHPFLQQATLLLAPLRTGSGTKLKILEAMACGLPFVTSSIGIEGIHGAEKAGLVADDTQGLIDAVLGILREPGLGQEMGKQGRRIVEQGYSWDSSARDLESAWQELMLTQASRG